jgi:hypothetical protein
MRRGSGRFDLGSTYERQSDRMTAIVAKIDEKTALLWLSMGEEEWITPADVPCLWRRDFTKRPPTVRRARAPAASTMIGRAPPRVGSPPVIPTARRPRHPVSCEGRS